MGTVIERDHHFFIILSIFYIGRFKGGGASFWECETKRGLLLDDNCREFDIGTLRIQH